MHACHAESVSAALGVTAAVLVGLAALIGFLVVRRRRKQGKSADGGGLSDALGDYSNNYFNLEAPRTGASERMSTGAISMGGIRDLPPDEDMIGAPTGARSDKYFSKSGRVAAGAAAYAARSGGKQESALAPEVVKRSDSLHVQEHPES